MKLGPFLFSLNPTPLGQKARINELSEGRLKERGIPWPFRYALLYHQYYVMLFMLCLTLLVFQLVTTYYIAADNNNNYNNYNNVTLLLPPAFSRFVIFFTLPDLVGCCGPLVSSLRF